jgi:hypothetical protein
MEKGELIARLAQQKQQLEQELTERIVQIENITAAIQAIEGKDITRPNSPPKNPFEGVPVRRINSDTYLNIARRLVDNKNHARTPGVRGEPLTRELNTRIGKVENIIIGLDNRAEQLISTRDTGSLRHLGQLQDDSDKLRIELEFYKDLSEAIQVEPRRLTREELEEERYKAKDWWKRRNPGK